MDGTTYCKCGHFLSDHRAPLPLDDDSSCLMDGCICAAFTSEHDEPFERNIGKARLLRDAGMEEALDHAGDDWRELANRAAIHFCAEHKGQEVMGEDIRFYVTKIVGPPHSDKVWGGFTAGLIRSGWLRKTGKYKTPQDPKSHACPKPLYRVP